MALGEGTASLDKALGVLELIGSTPDGVSNAELLDVAGLPKTTLYRILATLVERGLVRRDPVRRVYRMGFRYLELVRNAYLMPDLVAAASTELRSLRDLTGETSYLAVLDGPSVLSLERCDGAHSQRSSAALGQSKPLHCTGQGKAILSHLSAGDRDVLLRTISYDALTPRTLTDRRRLQIELSITRARGYAIDDEEIVLGVRCVAAPIVDPAGNVRGALSVAGPAYRLSLARLELLGPELADAGRRVGSQLAGSRTRVDNDGIEPVSESWAFHGAFPCWSAERGHLYWADTLAPAIHCFDGREDRLFARLDAPVQGMALFGDRLFVDLGTERVWFDPDGTGNRIEGSSAWNDPAIRPLAADSRQRAWASQQVDGETGCRIGEILAGGRFRVYWRLGEAIEAMTLTPDCSRAYAIAPESGTLYRLENAPTGESGTVRRVASMPKGSGRLSGVAIDEQGGVWTGLKDGWSLVRFAEDGNVDTLKSLPVAAPTGLAFASSADGPALYVTSDRHLQSLEMLNSAPWSGKLLRVRLVTQT
ncbi:IclR family transcriptional regulator domain-containing protein [Burkholderia multivorans]|uniref:IclR family transcriptional regulator domain-containing protein n=1 Tax=Burkholderia multivorans TaxID=87883 RepID=UPI001C24C02E|nr:IclR family transcriptional regulator C-terminal domain-containing protein [Burkholderia multivorans]MBU9363458.1 helix-turn-helix domain-containing protein [Burkholderia multivorans]